MSEFRRSTRLADRGLNSIFNLPPDHDAEENPGSDGEFPEDTIDENLTLPDRNQENVSLQRLYDCVKRNPVAITQAAKVWVQHYRLHKNLSLAELLSFVSSGAGCDQDFTPCEIQSENLLGTIREVEKRAREVPTETPFRNKRGRKTFKLRFVLMWSEITKECNSAALVFDHELNSFLTTLIIEFSKSIVRSFRFVGCLVCSCLTNGWVHVLKAKMEGCSTTEAQLITEQSKRENKVTAKKIKSLKTTLGMYQQQVSDLEAMIGRLFAEVYVVRFRDVCENVRAVVTEGIGQWCVTIPSLFLNDQYLKYLAWPLSDKEGAVRLAAVTVLLELYGKEENVEPLHEFNVRFRSRICEMVYDMNEAVTIKTLKLLAKFVHYGEITVNDIKHVYQLLADESCSLRNAVADLVCELLKENAREKVGSTEEPLSEEELVLHGLVNIFCELANENKNSTMQEDLGQSWTETQVYPVEFLAIQTIKELLAPLYERLEVLQNWNLMVERLNQERSKEQVNEGWLLMLIKIIDAAAQLAHAGQKDRTSFRGKKQDLEEKQKQEMTCVLMESLVFWINDFQADNEKVVCFIRMVSCLKTELFILKSATSSFVGILQNITEICFKHHHHEVIEECIGSLSSLCQTGPQELRSVALDFLKSCSDRIIQEVTSFLPSVLEGVGSGEQMTGLKIALERVKHLLVVEQHELLNTIQLTSTLTQMLTVCSEFDEFTNLAGVDLCQCGFLLILWSLVPSQGSTEDLNGLQNLMISVLRSILESSGNKEMKWEAVCLMVDLYLMFGHDQTPGDFTEVFPEDWMFDQLWMILQEKIQDPMGRDQALLQDLVVVGKLVTYGSLKTDQLKWIASRFFSLITHPKDLIVDLVKKVARYVRKMKANVLADVFLRAMMDCFDEVIEGKQTREEFLNLAQRIANSYLTFNNTVVQSRSHIYYLVNEGINRSMEFTAPKIHFITEGLSCFTPKLPVKNLDKLMKKLESYKDRISTEDWNTVMNYILSLKHRMKRSKQQDVVEDQPPSRSLMGAELPLQLSNSKNRAPFATIAVGSASVSESESQEEGLADHGEESEVQNEGSRRTKSSIGKRVQLNAEEAYSRKKSRL